MAAEGISETLRRVLIFRAERRRGDRQRLLTEPTWDILLNLAVGQAEGRDVSVLQACAYGRGSRTTGLRRLADLETAGLIERRKSQKDGRMLSVALSPKGANYVATMLHEEHGLYSKLQF